MGAGSTVLALRIGDIFGLKPPFSNVILVPAPARFRAGAGTVQTCYIAPSTAFTSSSTAVAESYSPLKWAVTTS